MSIYVILLWLFGQCKIVWPSKWAEQSSAAHEKTVILIDRRISEDDAQPLLAVNHNSMLQSLDSIVHRALYSVHTHNTTYSIFQQFIDIIFVDSYYVLSNGECVLLNKLWFLFG